MYIYVALMAMFTKLNKYQLKTKKLFENVFNKSLNLFVLSLFNT